MEVWDDSRIVYDGTVVRLRVGNVRLDNGALAHREVVEHPGGVCVVPFTGHSVLLVRQYRVAVSEYVLEVPAGKLEGHEDPLYRGACELEEETGYRAGRMEYIGCYYMAIGFCSERVHIYLAFELTHHGQQLEEEERIELVEVSLEEVRRSLKEHRFTDGKTVIGLQALLDHLDSSRAG
ncbi:MAG: NUDIX hydrolase [Candidatus Hydrogenedentes bacterium]|nr:NUDIX hydrolase [Candidatus Hydrogenedentota bacterium]